MRSFRTILLALMICTAAQAAPLPGTGEQQRAIKALSPGDVDDLRAGRGMGLAKAAELNGFPGPAHVIELADRLGLSAEQRAETQALAAQMKADAQRVGSALIVAEQALDRAFAERRINSAALQAKLAEIASLQGELRYVHLRAHLAQVALMTPTQIAHYDRLRGYGKSERASATRDGGQLNHVP